MSGDGSGSGAGVEGVGDAEGQGVGDAEGQGVDGASGEVAWDCSPWAGETRRILRSVLAESGIPHAWEGTVLVAPAPFEDQIDTLVDDVASTARRSLSAGRDTVAYDVTPWSAASQNSLVDAMVAETLAHEWDAEGFLVVYEDDSEVVEDLIDALGEPDGGDEMDGLELHDRLGEMFVAADRLVANPRDAQGARGIIATNDALDGVALPFGIDAPLWRDLRRCSNALVAALEGAESDDGASFEAPEPLTDLEHDDAGDGDDDDDGGDADELGDTVLPSVEGLARDLRDLLRRLV